MTCSYRFDAPTGAPSQLQRYDGWQCERETYEDTDFCIFHLSSEDKDSTTVTRRFLEEVRTEGRSHKTFIGAVFDHLDLSYASIDGPDNYPLIFHDTEIGRISLRKATVNHGIRCLCSDISKLNFFDGEFRQYVQLEESIIGEPEFDEARFESGLSLNRSVLTGFTRFKKVRFERDLLLRDATLDATESNTTDSDRRSADFTHDEDFRKYAEFDFHFDFADVSVEGLIDLSGSTVRGDCSFSEARFGDVRLVDMTIADNLDVTGCTFEEVEIRAIDSDHPILEFNDIRIDQGVVVVDENLSFDFRDAVLGDVEFDATDGVENAFEYVRFVNTDFDGFDFSTYSLELSAIGWEIHGLCIESETDADDYEVTTSELVSTYLRAKNGANHVGDDTAAAEFFIKEMQFRRRKYRRESSASGTFRSTVIWRAKWFANAILDVSSGYGERPSRTTLTSLVIVTIFAAVYYLLDVTLPYRGLLGYFVFSIEAFVALVIGNPGTTDSILSFVVALEGFTGAFLIALFVFTLTRSIKR